MIRYATTISVLHFVVSILLLRSIDLIYARAPFALNRLADISLLDFVFAFINWTGFAILGILYWLGLPIKLICDGQCAQLFAMVIASIVFGLLCVGVSHRRSYF